MNDKTRRVKLAYLKLYRSIARHSRKPGGKVYQGIHKRPDIKEMTLEEMTSEVRG